MKLLILVLILTGITFLQYARANPFDLYMNQMSADGTGYQNRQLSVPNSGAGVDGMLIYSGTNSLPQIATFASGCSITFGVFNCTGTGQVSSDWNSVVSPTQILNKPTIPAAQVNSDWNSVSGLSQILNKPTLTSGTVTSVGLTSSNLTVTGSPITTSGNLTVALPNTGTAGTYTNVTTDALGRVTSGTNASINDAPGRSLVTTTASTGYQISATRMSRACYEGSFSTTSTIGGPSSASIFLETADTNSTTPGDWTTKGRQTYSNTITLAIVLNQVQGNNWSMCRDIPAGKYVRVRSGSISGTASATINTEQQETLY